MTWQSIQSDILEGCKALLEPLGYKWVKSRMSFERPTSTGRLVVRLLFVASDVGNFSVQMGCGVRHDAIEQIVSAGTAPEKGSRSVSTTIHAEWSRQFWLNSLDGQKEAVAGLQQYVQEVAVPFLEQEYSLQDYSELLNVTDGEGNPIERVGMGIRFWQRGLVAARLAGDAGFESLRRHYAERVRTLGNGVYLAEFEKCLKYLDEHSDQGCRFTGTTNDAAERDDRPRLLLEASPPPTSRM